MAFINLCELVDEGGVLTSLRVNSQLVYPPKIALRRHPTYGRQRALPARVRLFRRCDRSIDHEGIGNTNDLPLVVVEENVRRQHWKINRSQPAAKAGRFFADMDVISDVANEKKAGGNDRRDHAGDVALPKISPNEIPAGRDENGADKIERGIDCR